MRRRPHPDMTRDFQYGHATQWERDGSLLCVGRSITQPQAWRWLAFDTEDGCLRGCGYERSFVRAASSADEAASQAAAEARCSVPAEASSPSAPPPAS